MWIDESISLYLCVYVFIDVMVVKFVYEYAPLTGCFLQYVCIFSVIIVRITKQPSAFKCKRLKCTLQNLMCTQSLKRSNLKIIFIQIGIKTCSGNYDSCNSKCKCAMNRLWRFAHAFHFKIAHTCSMHTCIRWFWHSTHGVFVLALKSWTWHFGCVECHIWLRF